MKRVLCIWLPNWPLQRLCLARPELKGQPLILYRQRPRHGAAVACCSPEAAARGIQPDMPLAEARTLASGQQAAESCQSSAKSHQPSAISRQPSADSCQLSANSSYLLPHTSYLSSPSAFSLQPSAFPLTPHLDRAALSALAAWCQQFSPTVGLEDVPEPAALLLDVSGAADRLGSEAALVQQVASAFTARGLLAHLGLGETVGAAWARAHFAGCGEEEESIKSDQQSGDSCQLAVVSSQSSGKSDQPLANPSYLIPPTSSLPSPPSSFSLQPSAFPLPLLRLPPDLLALLAELGLSSLEELRALPRAGLAARFGPNLLARIDQAAGERAEVITAERPDAPLVAEWDFESPTACQQAVEAVLDPVLEQLLAPLAQRRAGVTELECWLCPERGEPLRLRVGLFRPSNSARHVRELIQLQFERVRQLPPVSRVKMQVTAWQLLECRQRELPFDDAGQPAWHDSDEERRELAAFVDRLASRLGRDAVLRARPRPEAQPEHACHYESWLDQRPRRAAARRKQSKAALIGSAANPTAAASDACSPIRPLLVVRSPKHIDVAAHPPDGPPRTFRLAGCEHIVHRCVGPERIETGWWRRQSARRDYYRVENQHGHWHWLFRRLRDGQWFWQGEFG